MSGGGGTTIAINDNDGPTGPTGPSGPPRASITVNAECDEHFCRVRAGVPVIFEDTSTGTVSTRFWEFGDGV